MKNYVLRYQSPAEYSDKGWQNNVLPIGNGRLGACVFGGVDKERLQFNEKTLWRGGPSPKRPDYNGCNVKDSYKNLNAMRDALEKNKTSEVKRLANKLIGVEEGYGNYLNFGVIELDFGHKNATNYVRSLRLNDALSTVEYTVGGVKYKREYVAAYDNNAIAGRLSADEKFGFSLKILPAQDSAAVTYADASVKITGEVDDNGLKYYCTLQLVTDGQVVALQDALSVTDATQATFAFSACTDYKNDFPVYRGEFLTADCDAAVSTVVNIGFDATAAAAAKYVSQFFNRNEVDLGGVDNGADTDVLLAAYRKNPTTPSARYIEELAYQYGRYLLIASSIRGTLPANLQGIWNNSNTPAWGCDYHLNVNLQMCYWHAYTANLAELALPMIDYMNGLVAPGRVTAACYHDIKTDAKHPANGWVCHTQNTPFGCTAPGWNFYWGWSPAASSWMMQNCIDYYDFTGDVETLKKDIYPMMKENVRFWLQNLVYNQKQDRYVSTPSFSPEQGPISVGNAYEQEVVYMLFSDALRAAKVLGDEAFVAEVAPIRDKLKPLHVGRWGQIKEWYEEDDWYRFMCFRKIGYLKHGSYPGHRHCSHLIGLYPGLDISGDPRLAAAAKVSLVDRGISGAAVEGNGWSQANKTCLWARLGERENAYAQLNHLLSTKFADNMWDFHPPYQMDGNCGYTAAVTEMLVFSDHEHIALLPACPDAWSSGTVKGICARGGYTLDFKWSNGVVTDLTVYGSGKVKIVYNGETHEIMARKA